MFAFAQMPADAWILFLTRALRGVAYGFIAVMLGLYLAELGLATGDIGTLFTAALASGAVFIVLITAVADALGRRRILVVGAFLMAATGVVFATSADFLLLLLAAILGIVSPNTQEVGPFLSLEQAILPQLTADSERTSVFAWYNIVGSLATAVGALLAGAPTLLEPFGFTHLAAYRALMWLYVALGLAMAALFARLSPASEASGVRGPGAGLGFGNAHNAGPRAGVAGSGNGMRWLGIGPSRGIIFRLSLLFAMDGFGGGLVVQGLIAYWLNSRFGADPGALGLTFFAVNLLAAVSYLIAARLARRFGLLNTMVFSHLPANVLLILLPFVPSFGLALAILLARGLLSQMDVPTRQSYTMAVVTPAERSATAGLTGVARNVGGSIAPALTGYAFQVGAFAFPLVLAGSLKCAYDLLLLVHFGAVKPPEERERGERRAPA